MKWGALRTYPFILLCSFKPLQGRSSLLKLKDFNPVFGEAWGLRDQGKLLLRLDELACDQSRLGLQPARGLGREPLGRRLLA